jgi:hypothetical protein
MQGFLILLNVLIFARIKQPAVVTFHFLAGRCSNTSNYHYAELASAS